MRLDGDPRLPVAMRDLEALDPDVTQHLDQVALVAREQRVVDRLVAWRQRAAAQVVTEVEALALEELAEQLLTLRERHEQQRMIAKLVTEARVDLVVGQIRERLERLDR